MHAPLFGVAQPKAPWLVSRAFHAAVEPGAVPAVCPSGLTRPTPGTKIGAPKFVTVPGPLAIWFPGLLPPANLKRLADLPGGWGLPEIGWTSPPKVPT